MNSLDCLYPPSFSQSMAIPTMAATKNLSAQPSWIRAVDDLAIGINVFGLIGNFIVIATIVYNHFRPLKASVMIGHQAFVDFIICIISIANLSFYGHHVPLTGNEHIDTFICYVWNSKLFYWIFVSVSVLCLILLSVDRFLAVKKAMFYRTIKPKSLVITSLTFYPISIMVNTPFLIDTVTIENGKCLHGKNGYGRTLGINTFGTASFKVMGILWLCLLYFIPMVTMTTLYAITMYSFNTTAVVTSNDSERKRLSSQLTKSAIVVTALFMISFTVDTVYYLLGFFDFLALDNYRNPVNRVASFFINFHSVSPFVYCLVLQTFRERILYIVTCGRVKPAGNRISPITDSLNRETTHFG